MTMTALFSSIDDVEQRFAENHYILDRPLATTVYLAAVLQKPIFLEGEPGVGKTELAKVLARSLDTDLIRLQCYEGLDSQTALYEWNYPRQMLELRMQEARGLAREEIGADLFSEAFLLKRPLLDAIQADSVRPPVLLIDEIDRSDEEFEAFLLEVLSDFQISIPELGTITARQTPIVILTSNRTRELHDALKRRCLFHWIDYPDLDRELRIVRGRITGIEQHLATQICRFMQAIRRTDLFKQPGIAETLDWAQALLALGVRELDATTVNRTLGCILKYKGDMDKFRDEALDDVLAQATAGKDGKKGVGVI
jgi:MoxR-like ATPase